MKIDPKLTFWISFITTIAQGFTAGTIHLTGLVPTEYIPTVTAWLGFLVFVNMSFLTLMSGFSSNASGPLAPPPTIKEAKAVMSEAVNATVATGTAK